MLLALKQSAGSAAAQPSLNFGDGQSLIDLGSFAQNLHGGQLTEPLQLYVQGRSVVMLGMHGETPASVGRAGEAAIAAVLAANAQQRKLQFAVDQPELDF